MSTAKSFSVAERTAVYDAIFGRRDIRAYRPDPVAPRVLSRILRAAHHAPSVGFMQPWSFVVVADRALRTRVHAHFREVNAHAAQRFDGERAQRYAALKLQGILDAPLNMAVTCDPARAGEFVLGRDTMRQTDVYSTCLAIQNLWLAAHAEGVGVGWMSIMEPAVIKQLLGVPARVELVAYLTVGYPVEVPDEPMLQSVGWRRRLALSEVVRQDSFEQPALWLTDDDAQPAAISDSSGQVSKASKASTVSSAASGDHSPAGQRLAQLTKPVGSLGRVEALALQLCELQGAPYPSSERRRLLLFAADHGVTAQNVSAYNREVTAKMVYQFIAGGGAVNAFGRQHGLSLQVVDVGVDHDFGDASGLLHRKVRRATRDLMIEAAMTDAEMGAAIEAGRDAVAQAGALDVLLLGEMGIGNTTAATAMACAMLGQDAAQLTGRGTGIGDATAKRKAGVIDAALKLHGPALDAATAAATAPIAAGAEGPGVDRGRAMEALRCCGGYEIAALVGAIEAAAEGNVLVVLDGLITGVAALVAVARTPAVARVLVAGHLSAEPAHARVLQRLQRRPLLQLDLRLGEGSGAALALPLLDSACAMMREMRTFEEAGIEHAKNPGGLE